MASVSRFPLQTFRKSCRIALSSGFPLPNLRFQNLQRPSKLHIEAFTQVGKLLCTEAFAHRHLDTQQLVQERGFARRHLDKSFYREEALRTGTLTHRSFDIKKLYTQNPLHGEKAAHRQKLKLLHTMTRRSIYTEKLFTEALLYREALTQCDAEKQKKFSTQKL